jgi:hypothetical protein
VSRKRNVETAASASTDEYSYMLPHGTRSTERPRVTTEPTCSAQPSTVTATDARPTPWAQLRPSVRRPGSSPEPTPAGMVSTEPPAIGGSAAAARGGRRPNANSAAYPSIATT